MKVLIIKLGALGDIIISTAIINRITEHHRADDVVLLTSPAFVSLFSGFENLNVVAFERKGFLNKIKAIQWIRSQKFDRIYDLQSNDRTSFFCALSGSPYRAGNHPRFPYHKHPKTTYAGECHSFDRLNQIIESADIKPALPLPYLPVSQQTQTDVANWLKKHNLNNRSFVIFHAGSSPLHIKKRWPYFETLAVKLSDKFNVVWVGGDDDVELNRSLSNHVGIDATNAFTIHGLVELGKYARFAVTNDSAPMHILSCSNIPVLGLFGPTYARRTHALGQLENIIIANDLPLARNDAEFTPSDIVNISLEKVLNKLQEKGLV